MSKKIHVIMRNLYNDRTFEAAKVWSGKREELLDPNNIRHLVNVITNDEYFEEDDSWVEGGGAPLFGLSTDKPKDVYCAELAKMYAGNVGGLIKAINNQESIALQKLVVVESLDQCIDLCTMGERW